MAQPQQGMPQPSPQQIAAMQQQFAAEAQKRGLTVQQFVEVIKKERMEQMARAQAEAQARQQHGGGPGQPPQLQRLQQGQQGPPGQGKQVAQNQHQHAQARGQAQPIKPGPPNPVAIALANFLRNQPLKPRTCIFNGERKDMFRVKRALRALQSPAYAKARAKNPALPEITDRATLENTFKLLPMSMLALRVSKSDPHEGHDHATKKAKRIKGLWTVKIEQQQEAQDDMYYIWFYEGSQFKRKVYAVLALIVIFAVVLYPLWPLVLRQGVYYLSWGFLFLLGLFFAMAIFRVILFSITYFITPPGLWLFPNLWEDVSFMDSFRPLWGWHETVKPKKKKKSSSKSGINADAAASFAGTTGTPAPATASTTGTDTQIQTATLQQRTYTAPKVEELDDDE
ncbi:translocation protein Sec62-domain-containing protein [Pseudomassariella vexata]|uniref:Translocation protein SEC62 n=1 Tax=Pseudomassariella vexata TaxID=1141098 RepID=A0A1Y2DVB9_9PEZI|nr:translocation protein Sec62-domain-containing protein [Pseudomassariella vexata]ORY63221.1 translocation protein Sec62-domain-containing protein [Pseudomassariella vexata]